MWAFENPVTGWESKLVHDCKMMSKKERREDLDRETLRASGCKNFCFAFRISRSKVFDLPRILIRRFGLQSAVLQ
jgi:hypothetical protein